MSSKNPVALWLDSFLGTPIAKDASSGVSVAPATAGAGSVALGATGDGAATGGGSSRSYFDNSVAAYAFGLGLCFAVNFISKSGQPGEVSVDGGIFAVRPIAIILSRSTCLYSHHG